jgi:hypothetical protein
MRIKAPNKNKTYVFLMLLCITMAIIFAQNSAHAFCLYFENNSKSTIVISEAHVDKMHPPYMTYESGLKVKPFRLYPGQFSQKHKICSNCCWNWHSIAKHYNNKIENTALYNLTKLKVTFFDASGKTRTAGINLGERTDTQFQIGGYLQVTFTGGGTSDTVNVDIKGYKADQTGYSPHETSFKTN